jgi:predicted Zn-dependent peptidase
VSLALLGAACAKGPSGGTTATTTNPAATATAAPAPAAAGFRIPVEYYKLDNGLRVVLSPDTTSPTVTVAVYYNIGFRIEPKDRTGFAHLFEHMMFQGSQNLSKMEFVKLVQKNGGILNGSTRFDYTNYFETLPSHKLETALWAESDRMKGLAIMQENLTNQQGVVKSEVRVNVLNQPLVQLLGEVVQSPRLPASEVDRLKASLKRQLNVQKAQPQSQSNEKFLAAMFPDQPYGRAYPTEAMLDSYDLAKVRRFNEAQYGAQRTHVYVAGLFNPGVVESAVRKSFGNWKKGPAVSIPEVRPPAKAFR